MFKERTAQSAFKEAVLHGKWDDALKSGMVVLRVNPWDVSILSGMATSCKNLAETGGPAYSRFADCSLFYAKCAEEASS